MLGAGRLRDRGSVVGVGAVLYPLSAYGRKSVFWFESGVFGSEGWIGVFTGK